jgi:ribose/xylose/arabinose/galactoside ABC-type transport system permease subunit
LLIGVAIAINSVSTGGISLALVNATHALVLGLPLAFFYGLLLAAICWYVFSYTPLGRYVYFVGASRSVARLSGIPVDQIRAGALITSAFGGLACRCRTGRMAWRRRSQCQYGLSASSVLGDVSRVEHVPARTIQPMGDVRGRVLSRHGHHRP